MAFGALAVAGTGLKVFFAHSAGLDDYDIQFFLRVGDLMRNDLLGVYAGDGWVYPPAYLPWVFVATSGTADDAIGFNYVLRFPLWLVDICIAWLVQDFLRRHGADEAKRLVAAGCVLIGPMFVAISGHHGQFDSVVILPAVAALWVWDRGGESRALLAGILIGVAASLKPTPFFLLVALLPWAKSRAEIARLVIPALAIPLLLLAPFLIAHAGDTVEGLRENRGFPGLNGVSLPVSLYWDNIFGTDPTRALDFLTDAQQPIVALTVAAIAVLLWRHRLPPAQGAALVWLGVLAATPHLAWQYPIWGLPFFLMGGYVRAVAIAQLVAIVPLLIFYRGEQATGFLLHGLYFPFAFGLYVAVVVAFVLIVRKTLATRTPQPTG